MTNDLEPPEASAGDHAYAVGRALLGMIPYAGVGATELLKIFFIPPFERRRAAWMESVHEHLRELEASVRVEFEHLAQDDGFLDTLFCATQIAMRTSQEEKLEALRNAVLNTVIPESPDDSLRHMFLGMVDMFTEWHLRTLKLFVDPASWFDSHRELTRPRSPLNMVDVVQAAFPLLVDRQPFVAQVVNDLTARELAEEIGGRGMVPYAGAFMRPSITKVGRQFIAFIDKPVLKDDKP